MLISEVKSRPRVRVIVVNFNGKLTLARCLRHLIVQSEARFEAVIVDNNSNDGSLDNLPQDSRITVMRSSRNIGFAGANNLGFVDCKTPYIALLNPDAFAAPSWLEALLRAAERHPAFSMFGSLQLQAENPENLDGAGDVYSCAGSFWRGGNGQRVPSPLPAGEAFAPCAAAALYRTEVFASVGGFDLDYFCYAEDIDLAFRIRLAGGRCLQVPDAVVLHIGSATTGVGSDFSVYHLIRNQIWTFLKCMPAFLLVPMLPIHMILLARIWWRARALGQGYVVYRGISDALLGLGQILRKRHFVQSKRSVSTVEVARFLNWSLAQMQRRAIVLKPVLDGQKQGLHAATDPQC